MEEPFRHLLESFSYNFSPNRQMGDKFRNLFNNIVALCTAVAKRSDERGEFRCLVFGDDWVCAFVSFAVEVLRHDRIFCTDLNRLCSVLPIMPGPDSFTFRTASETFLQELWNNVMSF